MRETAPVLRLNGVFSLSTSLRAAIGRRLFALAGRRSARSCLDNAHSAVGVDEDLVRDAPDIRLRDPVDPVDRAEQFPPVSIPRLVSGELNRETLIVGEAPDQIRFGPRFDHLELVVR